MGIVNKHSMEILKAQHKVVISMTTKILGLLTKEPFEKEIDNDLPAIFLYSPKFIYVVPKRIQGVAFKRLTVPSERFSNVYEWYTDTEPVWNVFVK